MAQEEAPSIEATCSLGVKILSWAFFGLFAGFGAAQALESSLNATLGFINLACLYFAFVVVGLICPPIVDAVVSRHGWRAILIPSACTYIVMIVSNLVTGTTGWVVQPIASTLLGTGAAFLWTTQNLYFGQCAYLAGTAKANAEGAASATQTIAAMTTHFNSSFFGVFQFSNTTGCLISSSLLLAFADIAWVKMLLFFVLAVAAICGAAVLLLLPTIDHNRDSQEATTSVTAALRAATDCKFALLLPWMFTNGMSFAFVNGDFTADVVSPLLGPSYVGFMMTAFFASDAFFSVFWGQLISRHYLGRRTAFIFSGLFWIVFVVMKIMWKRDPNFVKGDDWTPIVGSRVDWLDVVQPLLLAVIAGAGDGFWMPGPPATLQSFFADSPNLLGTMAAYKAFQSLGFATQFTFGATLGHYPIARDLILLGFILASFVAVLFLDTFKQSLDQITEPVVQEATLSDSQVANSSDKASPSRHEKKPSNPILLRTPDACTLSCKDV